MPFIRSASELVERGVDLCWRWILVSDGNAGAGVGAASVARAEVRVTLPAGQPAGQVEKYTQQGLDIKKLIESGFNPKRSRFRADAPIPSVLENTKRHPALKASSILTFNKAVCTPLHRCANRQLVVRRCAVSPCMWRTPPPATSLFRRTKNGCAPSANPKQ